MELLNFICELKEQPLNNMHNMVSIVGNLISWMSFHVGMLILFMAVPIALLDEGLIAILARKDAAIPVDAHMIDHVGLFLGSQVA